MTWYLDTDYPVAINSLDHIHYLAKYMTEDLAYNTKFNSKLYQLCEPPISVLDVGCGGGNFVKTILDDGNDAVGLEGSDYPKKLKRAAWAAIPDNLFSCDVTQPFTLHKGNHVPYLFDVVTAWEFVEHIEESDLPQVFKNIYSHLKYCGLFIMTTPDKVERDHKRSSDHHRTRKNWMWWDTTISQFGLIRSLESESIFGRSGRYWVRTSRVRRIYQKMNPEE